MLWHEITVHTTEEATELISSFFHELGAGGVSIEESGTLNKKRDTTYGLLFDRPLNNIPEGRAEVKGYFAEGYDIKKIMEELEQSVERLSTFDIDTGNPTFSIRQVDDESWANEWKKYFKPIRVTNHLTIKPTWEKYEPSADEIILELDPGMAFGTGTHATTSLCLKILEQVVQGGEDVIDVGTGSGILSIAAAKLGAEHVLAIDLDPVAVKSAGENTKLNGMQSRIMVSQSDLLGILEHSEKRDELNVKLPVQIVVANILAEIILLFVDDVYQALEPGGLYIVSGVIKDKQAVVEDALKRTGFEIVEVYTEEDWVALVARKM